jgi:hypothetical protein
MSIMGGVRVAGGSQAEGIQQSVLYLGKCGQRQCTNQREKAHFAANLNLVTKGRRVSCEASLFSAKWPL